MKYKKVEHYEIILKDVALHSFQYPYAHIHVRRFFYPFKKNELINVAAVLSVSTGIPLVQLYSNFPKT
jgi:hypothetical protein